MRKVARAALAVCLTSAAMGAQAWQQGDWIVRGGIATVDPDSSSDTIFLPGGVEAEAEVKDDTQLALIGAYMMTDKIGIELLASTPFDHDIEASGKGAAKGVNLDAGATKHLPPTLSVQWYPLGGSDGIQPYVGIGMNYTYFFDEDVDGELVDLLSDLTGGAVTDANLDIDPSVGLAAQVGLDWPVTENLAVNVGVWYIDIETTAEVTAKAGPDTAAKVDFDVEINPWVYNIGIAYRF